MSDLSSSPVPALTDSDHVRGNPNDPLIIFYGDLSCPHCALAHQRLRGWPFRIAFRHFALRSRPRALTLGCVAEAAGLQGRFWEMHDALLEDQAHTEDPHIWARARELGLDLSALQHDRRSQATIARVQADLHGALRAGVARTPTLFIGGHAYPGPPSRRLLDELAGVDVR